MKDTFKEISQVVKRMKNQDQSAFPHLYELTYQHIYFLCFSILKNEEDAQDAVQETYIKIIKNISFLKDNQLFIAWANKITYSICMRMLSKNKPVLMEEDFLESFSHDNEYNNLYFILEKSEKSQVLATLIDELHPNLRSTLLLKYFYDLKIRQISKIMNCPVGTVKSRLNTAKKILKSSIEQEKRGNILLCAFTYLPLREAFALSASQSVMTPGAANAAFEVVITQSSINSNLSFIPQPTAKPMQSSLMVAISRGSIIGASATALSVALVLTPPSISNIKVHQPSTGYTSGPISITANIDAPLNSIANIYLISNDGRRIDGSLDKDKVVNFSVIENGTYTIHVLTTNGLKSMAKAEITTIDNKAPTIINFTYTQTNLVLALDDVYSGIDFTSVIGETESGEKIHPISIDQTAKTVTFIFPKENFRLTLIDFVGNTSYHKVSRVDI